MTEDKIAILDGDWAELSDAERTALRLARRMTLTPHDLTTDDVISLKPYYSDAQITELIYAIARFNSVNRWTDALGLPQDEQFFGKPLLFNAPTAPEYADRSSAVLPAEQIRRPSLESRDRVEAALAECQAREPLVRLPDETEVSELLAANRSVSRTPQWIRALAIFPDTCRVQIAALQAIEDQGRLPLAMKAQIFWIVARENRAWYSLGQAQRRLRKMDWADDAIFALDDASASRPAAERLTHAFARKLTVNPRSITDKDISELREHFADGEVAEIVYLIAAANMFDRFTEALQLPLEP